MIAFVRRVARVLALAWLYTMFAHLGGCAPSIDHPPRPNCGEVDEPEREGLWEDHRDLILGDRMKWRPGNFTTLATIATFLNAQYAVRPRLESVAFPCDLQGQEYRSLDAYEESLSKKEARVLQGTDVLRNKLRSFTINIRSMEIRNIETKEPFEQVLSELNAPEYVLDRASILRESHDGRAIAVKAVIYFESLQSEKVEGALSDSFVWFVVVRSGNTWGVCLYAA